MTKTKTIREVLYDIQQTLNVPKGQMNKFGGYKYRSCEDIVEAAKKVLPEGYTLTFSDAIEHVGDRYYIKATATLTGDGGFITSVGLAREAENKKGMDESQITGTASSYARKYAANGLLAIDDTKDADTDAFTKTTRGGNQASKSTATKTKAKAKPTTTAKALTSLLQTCKTNEDLNQFRLHHGKSIDSLAEKDATALRTSFKALKVKFKKENK